MYVLTFKDIHEIPLSVKKKKKTASYQAVYNIALMYLKKK